MIITFFLYICKIQQQINMKMKRLLLPLMLLMIVVTCNAQIVKGDMNDDGVVDISDVVSSVNVVLGSQPVTYIYASDIVDPYQVDNSKVIGTWYKSKTDKLTFNEDGTTDYEGAERYEFMPYQGKVVFYNPSDIPFAVLHILKATDDNLYISELGSSTISVYGKTIPVYKVTSIFLSDSFVVLSPDGTTHLTATVLPSNADDSSVTWSSSDENVATIMNGLVTAVAEGLVTITCSANDGSGVMASCEIRVWVDHSDEHEYVDLGLSSGTLWATTNIGASSPEDFGDYFAWGETESRNDGMETIDWSAYKYAKGSKDSLTKYCNNAENGYNGYTDTKTKLENWDDAAFVNWGNKWCMPTKDQMTELRLNCTWTWTTQNDVFGRLVTGPNGNTIFLPAAGFQGNDSEDVGAYGYYWSSTLYSSNPNLAHYVGFVDNIRWGSSSDRCLRFSIRPVRSK